MNALAEVTFVDTNILVYSHDTHDDVKHRAAKNLLAELWMSGLGVLSTQVASRLSEQHTINFWDALIVEAALRASAAELVTEDLQHGRRFGTLQVRNPFLPQ